MGGRVSQYDGSWETNVNMRGFYDGGQGSQTDRPRVLHFKY